MKNQFKFLPILAVLFLAGCNGFFDKDNTPTPNNLIDYTPGVQLKLLWSSKPTVGMGSDYLKLVPAISDNYIITASNNGWVSALEKTSGKTVWAQFAKSNISAGPAANEYAVVVAGQKGVVTALSTRDGHILWQKLVSSETLAPPQVGADVAIVKTIDGKVSALSLADGHLIWSYEAGEPNLILRSGSQPLVRKHSVLVGFANGQLVKLALHSGSLIWQQAVAYPTGAFAIERMVDVDANPVVNGDDVFSATYQGKIASLDLRTGAVNWNKELSSYTGMCVDADHAFVTDANGNVFAMRRGTGRDVWKMSYLKYRNLTAPNCTNQYIAIGDSSGYLHILNKENGKTVARTRVSYAGIMAQPLIANNIIYMLTKDGRLAAFTIN